MERILITPAEIQKLMGFSPTSFYRMLAKRGDFPGGIRAPGHRRWRRDDVLSWIEKQTRK
ncbi:helix-turn-helix transcriptional regulator [Ferrovum myxofaciens]|uniref:Helix-turn-helix domain-containing protein n=1 Tax=Ferrovum myxofaciens TaxID=416213 RepID=A0A9E6MX04_9PROT|nr:helix-turn-helix domain-containing protein [Ferrovum myxofaciens]QKE37569.1 MAG: helix-turn-helix domain-containing protein [Ferrovum myxofaciens]QWY75223.1 MAG: helix-turn-helix domain-containing protein [Ferrovum myxofaciens]QWY77957.1 MAG: helix-turn-helix domain-containing protein [Ferrovum myxofaciens]